MDTIEVEAQTGSPDGPAEGSGTTQRAREVVADVAGAARRLVGAHRDVGAIVLECANMPPYRAAVETATGLPVYDAAQLVAWFHAGLAATTPRYGRRDLW